MEGDDLKRIDELNRKLYSTDQNAYRKSRHGILHKINHSAKTAWESASEENVKQKLNFVAEDKPVFKKFFIGSLIVFVIALGFGAYKYFSGGTTVSSDNITLSVLGNAFTPGGEPLPLTVEIANRNSVSLEYADLVVDYAKSGDTLNPSDNERIRTTVGTIAPGKTKNQDVSVTLYGEEGSSRDLLFTLQYRVSGSNAIYEKVKHYTVTVNSSPIALQVLASDTVAAGQNYTLRVAITPNSKEPITDMVLKVEYPNGFSFSDALPTPTYLNNVWALGDLPEGKTKEIVINGVVSGQDKEERSFRVYAGKSDGIDKNAIGVMFNSTLHTVTITKPFIEATLLINGSNDKEIPVPLHSTVRGEIKWANNLPVQINDAEITASLVGDRVDKTSVQAGNGFYNSGENKIVWNKDTDNTFGSIEPGESGTVGFTFATLSSGTNLTPNIVIKISISGKQPSEGNIVQSVDSFEQKTIKFNSDFQVSAEAYYHTGPFTNTGPIPPHAEQKTTYTLKWIATNSLNDLSGVTARAALPPYVHFLNQVSPSSESVTIDSVTGDIVWNIGSLKGGTGFTSAPLTVYFQVELVPSLSQVGSTPTLLLQTSATGTDTYTNAPLTSSWNVVTTRLYNDGIYTPGDEKVVQ